MNDFARRITSTCDVKQIKLLINSAIPRILEVNPYYNMLESDYINHRFLYDGGYFFNDVKVPVIGTGAKCVIRNQSELILPDLQQEV